MINLSDQSDEQEINGEKTSKSGQLVPATMTQTSQSSMAMPTASNKMSKLKYVRDKLLRKSSILGNSSQNVNESSKQRRSNSTYLANTSNSSVLANHTTAIASPTTTGAAATTPSSNLMAMASTASSEFSLVVGRPACSPVAAVVRTPGAQSLQASASFRHLGVEHRCLAGMGKKPRIVSAIAQQQILNEDEEVIYPFCFRRLIKIYMLR